MANANAKTKFAASDWPPMYIVVTAGSPPVAHACFNTWSRAARYILANGMRAVAWIEKI